MLRIQRSRNPVVLKEVAKMFAEHLSEDILSAAIKKGKPLDQRAIKHSKECRDCFEFVRAYSSEARQAGLSFPDLLPQLSENDNN